MVQLDIDEQSPGKSNRKVDECLFGIQMGFFSVHARNLAIFVLPIDKIIWNHNISELTPSYLPV